MGFKERLIDIKCFAYDFDGVMTDNRCLVDEDGKEAVFVNRSDGYAIARFKELGIRQVIISTEKNPVVEARARKLDIEVYQDASDKAQVLKKYCECHGIEPEEVFFIGNDLNDLAAFSIAGLTGAPKDAEEEIRRIADWVSDRNGGYGVIRQLYDVYRALSEEETSR